MTTRDIKKKLIEVFGENAVAYIQALRFAYLVKTRHSDRDPEVDLLPIFLKEGDVAVDVGANGANWTYYLSHSVGVTGAVVAFEADPYYAKATELTTKLLRLRNVRFFPYGLSESDETVWLRISDPTGARLSGRSHVDKSARADDVGIQRVSLRSMDGVAKEYRCLTKASLIKCDVEGYELYVFRGARTILDQARPVIVLEVGNFARQGYTPEDLFVFFNEKGYQAFAVVSHNQVTATGSAFECGGAVSVNRVLVPCERLSQFQLPLARKN
jgi:FkbM family methyltransferase